MSRIFGITAVFVGWLSFGIGAGAGLVVSEFFGLNYVEGPLPPIAVYGISGAVVLWALVAAAVVTAVPMAMAMVADDPRRSLLVWAAIMAGIALALVPDPLGRAFGLPLLGGAVCLMIGGELIHRETMATGSMTAREPTPNVSGGPFPPSTSEPGIAPAGTPAPPPESPRPTRKGARGTRRATPEDMELLCPWCSAEVSSAAGTCPSCGAVLDAAVVDEVPIPGLTVVPPELRRYAETARGKRRGPNLLSMIFRDDGIPTDRDAPQPSEAAALLPPSQALKTEMARLDAEIAAGVFPMDANLAGDGPGVGGPEPTEPSPEPAEPRATSRRRKPRT